MRGGPALFSLYDADRLPVFVLFSIIRQVREKQIGEERKWGLVTFSIKGNLIDNGEIERAMIIIVIGVFFYFYCCSQNYPTNKQFYLENWVPWIIIVKIDNKEVAIWHPFYLMDSPIWCLKSFKTSQDLYVLNATFT